MKFAKLTLAVAIASTASFALDVGELAKRSNTGYKKTVKLVAPDESTIPNNQYGELVKYGKELFVHTYKYIGPDVENPEMRYAGNNFSCQTCHLEAGTKPYASPMIGITSRFPQYRPREDNIGTLAARTNGCMQRSMNGYPLPEESLEMKAFLAYYHWLSQGVPVGAKVEGIGLYKADRKIVNQKKADVKHGEEVYKMHCAVCHGENGEGIKNPPNEDGTPSGYTFPPLWGEDSYNSGAGMYRQIKAYDFIYGNMPLGATPENPILTPQEAYDVAAYINDYDKYRPKKINRSRDFVDLKVKAADVDFGPYADKESDETHKYGPYKNIIIPAKK